MRSLYLVIFLIFFIVNPACAEAEVVVNKVVAIVNDEIITQQDVDQLLAVLYAQYVHAYKKEELLEKMEEAKKNILEQIIEDKLILSRAKELNVSVRDEEIDSKLDYVKGGFSSENDFHETLKTQGITLADLKDRYKDQIMMKKAVDFMIKSKVSVLPSEVNEYYEEHRLELKRNERRKARHILIKAEDEAGLELANLEIEGIYNKLKEGYDFAELARDYSHGPNKEQGGDMGYVEQGEMLAEIDTAIFSLKTGEFSEPVRSQIGYHIFKVEDIEVPVYLSLEELQDDIKNMLFQKKFKEKLDEWLAELRSKAYISIK